MSALTGRIEENLAKVSRILNAATGGDSSLTLCAQVWRDRSPIRPWIDGIFGWLLGETDHCRKAWEWHEATLGKTQETTTTDENRKGGQR